jgi:hypothetical protein
MPTLRLITAGILTLLLLFTIPAFPRTWHVQNDGTGDAPTIQAGIDSTVSGDSVLVAPGTYFENINFLGKDVVVKSLQGPEATKLVGNTQVETATVAMRSGEGSGAVIQGFTITGGRTGVNIRDAQGMVLGNIIEENQGAGGVFCSTVNSQVTLSPMIKDNVIRNNIADTNGGGIGVDGYLTPRILGNVIVGNRTGFGDGGGIYLIFITPGAIVSGNRVEGNVAADHGGGIYAGWGTNGSGSASIEIFQNIIRGNIAHGRAADFEGGGGIWLGATGGSIHHNTIVGNSSSDDAGGAGGGIAVVEETSVVIEQNIIAFSPVGKAISCFSSTPVLRNNLAWANQPEDIGGICAPFWDNNGNIIANPQFCDTTSGDFSLASSSPAMLHPAGPLGAIATPGCAGTPIRRTTWGTIKTKFYWH